MQTPQTTAAASQGAPASAAQGAASTRRASGSAGGADVFAGLLALVADTHAPTEPAAGPASGTAEDADNPALPDGASAADQLLASLLGASLASGVASTAPGRGHAPSSQAGPAAAASAALPVERGQQRASSNLAVNPGGNQPPGAQQTAQGAGIDIQRLGMVAADSSEALRLEASLSSARLLPNAATPPIAQASALAASHLQGVGRQTTAAWAERLGEAPRGAAKRGSSLTSSHATASSTASLGSTSATITLDTARLQPWSLQSNRANWAMSQRAAVPMVAQMDAPGLISLGSSESLTSGREGDRGHASMLASPAAANDVLGLSSSEAGGSDAGASSTSSLSEAGLADPMAPEPDAAGHLDPNALRHATLRVEDGQDGSIEIQLSMKGQEVSVDFLTDNAEARQNLQQSATPVLGDLLNRSGMQLGGVSVGGQATSSGGEQQRHGDGRQGKAKAVGAATGGAPAVGPADRRPGIDGSDRLDVFA